MAELIKLVVGYLIRKLNNKGYFSIKWKWIQSCFDSTKKNAISHL